MLRRTVLPLVFWLAFLAAAPGCFSRRGPLVLVTVAGLRADALAPAGFPKASAWLAGAARADVLTSSPETVLALAALHTGEDPARLGLRHGDVARLPAKVPTLAEQFAAKGYATGAFVGDSSVSPNSGLARGFGTWIGPPAGVSMAVTGDEVGRAVGGDRTARDVVDAAVGWYDAQGGKPVFLWIHLGDLAGAAANAPDARAAYSAAAAGVDEALGALAARLGDGAKAVLASTSGLALGENGETLHGLTLADGVIRVPAVLRGLGSKADPAAGFRGVHAALARAAGIESSTETGPTLVTTHLAARQYGWPASGLAADASGVLKVDEATRWAPAGGAALEGAAAWDAAPEPLRRRLAEAGVAPWDAPRRRLAVLADIGAAVRALGQRDGNTVLARLESAIAAAPDALVPRTLLVNVLRLATPEVRERFRARQAVLIDEIERLAGDEFGRRIDAAEAIVSAGDGARALGLLKKVDAAALGTGERLRLARTLLSAGGAAEATALIEALAAAEPDAPELQEALGDVLLRGGNAFRARQAYEKALAVPRGRTASLTAKLGDALVALGDRDAALARYGEAVRIDPPYRYPHARAAEIFLERKDEGAAASALVQSLVPSGDALRDVLARADLLESKGLARAAAIELDRALKERPGDERLGLQLVRVLVNAGGTTSARQQIEPLLAARPDNPGLLVELARLEAVEGRPDRALSALERAEPRAGPELTARVRQDPLFQKGGSAAALSRRAAGFAGRGQRPQGG